MTNHDSRVVEEDPGRSKMVEDEYPTNPNQEDQEYEEAEILIDTIMEGESIDLSPEPLTPTISIHSPNKADESPSKRAKTGTSTDPTTNQ